MVWCCGQDPGRTYLNMRRADAEGVGVFACPNGGAMVDDGKGEWILGVLFSTASAVLRHDFLVKLKSRNGERQDRPQARYRAAVTRRGANAIKSMRRAAHSVLMMTKACSSCREKPKGENSGSGALRGPRVDKVNNRQTPGRSLPSVTQNRPS